MSQAQQHAVMLAAQTPLQREARYMTPTFRVCQWLGASAEQGGGHQYSVFAYVPLPGEPQHCNERFFLSERNYRVLRPL